MANGDHRQFIDICFQIHFQINIQQMLICNKLSGHVSNTCTDPTSLPKQTYPSTILTGFIPANFKETGDREIPTNHLALQSPDQTISLPAFNLLIRVKGVHSRKSDRDVNETQKTSSSKYSWWFAELMVLGINTSRFLFFVFLFCSQINELPNT